MMDYSKLISQVDTLYDLLNNPLSIENALEKALEIILEAINKSGGILVVQSPNENEPLFLIGHNLSQNWEILLKKDNSILLSLAKSIIVDGEDVAPNDSLDLGTIVPICTEGETLGVLMISGAACNSSEAEALGYFTRAIARKLITDYFQKETALPNEELAALQLISAISNIEISPDELQARIARSLCQILSAENCSFVMVDKGDYQIAFKKMLVNDTEWDHHTQLKLDKGIIAECIRTGQTIKIDEVATNHLYHPEFDDIRGIATQSILCAPLIIDKSVQGAIVLYNKKLRPFDSYDQKLLGAMANLIAYAINDINLVHQLRVTSAELEVNRWQLLRSRNTLRALFDSIPLSFYIVDQKHELVAINLSRAKRLGDRPSEMVGKICYKALYNLEEICPGCKVNETLYSGKSTHRIERNFLENAEIIEWEINTYPIKDENGEVVQAIHLEEDMTEKRQLENQVMQSEKLAAVGQLAAGIAHEINNPLTAIVANVQLLKNQDDSTEDMMEALDLIELAGNRATQVVRNLLNLARKDHYDFVLSDLNESIDSALSLVRHELDSNGITLNTNYAEKLPFIKLSQEHIQGVWTNLILNAIDAQKYQGAGEISISTNQQKNNVIINISDKGNGISLENTKRIFEPFYTTKDTGSGTGLGLTISQKVIKHHGGQIQVSSKLGEGTKFSIVLPV